MDSTAALADQVARLRAEAAALVGLDLGAVDGATGPSLHAQVRTVTDQLHAFGARLLARIEADGRWSAGGSRTFPDWMARRELASVGAVRRQVALGRALDTDLRTTALEVQAGRVSLEHAQVLARLGPTSEARRAALAGDRADLNESYLLACARTFPVDQYRREVKAWAAKVDAAAAEEEHERACAKEHLTLSRRVDGIVFTGFLTHEHGEALATALRAVAGVPPLGDERSREERQAAALVDLVRLVLDKGLSGGGQQVRPQVVVHVDWATMQRLADEHPEPPARAGESAGGVDPETLPFDPAALQGGEPIPMSLLRRIACDSEISRVVFGPDSAVLDVGRAQRTYTGQQRRAVVARDGSCRYPGCGAPVVVGEVHHVVPWAAGGRTSVENGVLLCYHHHDLVHRRHLRVRRTSGGWEFHRADGSRLRDEIADSSRAAPGAPPGTEIAPLDRAEPCTHTGVDPSRPRPAAA